MTKSIFIATDAAGKTHKRTSESRTYSHAVVVLPNYSFDMSNADRDEKTDGMNFDYISKANPAKVAGHTRETYIAARRAERVALVEQRKADGYFGNWQVAGWCGRRDLASKLAAQMTGPRYSAVAILEATKA